MGSVSRRLKSNLDSGAVERARRAVKINAALNRFRASGRLPPTPTEAVLAAVEAAGAEPMPDGDPA